MHTCLKVLAWSWAALCSRLYQLHLKKVLVAMYGCVTVCWLCCGCVCSVNQERREYSESAVPARKSDASAVLWLFEVSSNLARTFPTMGSVNSSHSELQQDSIQKYSSQEEVERWAKEGKRERS